MTTTQSDEIAVLPPTNTSDDTDGHATLSCYAAVTQII